MTLIPEQPGLIVKVSHFLIFLFSHNTHNNPNTYNVSIVTIIEIRVLHYRRVTVYLFRTITSSFNARKPCFNNNAPIRCFKQKMFYFLIDFKSKPAFASHKTTYLSSKIRAASSSKISLRCE